jgi:hypothetical protein
MDRVTAEKLLDHAITSVGDSEAFLYQIGNGEWVCRIRRRDYWLWSFADLHTYVHELKAQGKQQQKAQAKAKRRESYYEEEDPLGSINPSEAYHLVMS